MLYTKSEMLDNMEFIKKIIIATLVVLKFLKRLVFFSLLEGFVGTKFHTVFSKNYFFMLTF